MHRDPVYALSRIEVRHQPERHFQQSHVTQQLCLWRSGLVSDLNRRSRRTRRIISDIKGELDPQFRRESTGAPSLRSPRGSTARPFQSAL